VALRLHHFRRRKHIGQSDAYSATVEKAAPLRSGRTKQAPYASSLVVSDIAEADSSAGQVVQVPGLSPQSNSSAGAATAQTQGYDRPDESQMDAGCAWWTFATTMLTEHPSRDRAVEGFAEQPLTARVLPDGVERQAVTQNAMP
jgi:hypothetical protein